ncbi:DUF3108 domain-containing protein [Albimonas sp. CAU 1670]|uniref:DUF3108 domain-containing protein n=1 Tax=Albimonas sp. CAU 1670 TaxID=3032599 RepID=UPI0023DB1F64|nr:DUF3108 domain-containing protein [Albimonas sp. CAU 1670]MDF2233235.1 DUF3108 domain-containing protein [Albimonas sp. CAU 1670]
MTREPAPPETPPEAAEAAAVATGTRPRRPARRLPIRSRAGGTAVVALCLSVLAGLGMPLAERYDHGSAVAATVADAGRFEVWFGGLPIGSLDFALSVGDARYSATAEARPSRTIDTLFGARLQAEGEGLSDERLPRPTRFEFATRFGGDAQRVTVAYSPPGRPQAVQAIPEWKPRDWEIDPTAQEGVTDPIGAAALFLTPTPPETLCNGAVEVFDGRRRSRIELDEPSPKADGWRCEGRWMRVAGFRPRDLDKEPVPVAVDFAASPDGLARVMRLEARTGYGLAVATRVVAN